MNLNKQTVLLVNAWVVVRHDDDGQELRRETFQHPRRHDWQPGADNASTAALVARDWAESSGVRAFLQAHDPQERVRLNVSVCPADVPGAGPLPVMLDVTLSLSVRSWPGWSLPGGLP